MKNAVKQDREMMEMRDSEAGEMVEAEGKETKRQKREKEGTTWTCGNATEKHEITKPVNQSPTRAGYTTEAHEPTNTHEPTMCTNGKAMWTCENVQRTCDSKRKDTEMTQRHDAKQTAEDTAQPCTTPPHDPATSTREPTMRTNGEVTQTRENEWQGHDTAQRTPESVQKTGSNPIDATTHPQTSLFASTHATHPTPQLGQTRTNTTKVAPGGASEEREQRGKGENEARKEKAERRLDWAEEVEREYEQKLHIQPTTPCGLSCLQTSAAQPWRNL
jgi:hypothetical protein